MITPRVIAASVSGIIAGTLLATAIGQAVFFGETVVALGAAAGGLIALAGGLIAARGSRS